MKREEQGKIDIFLIQKVVLVLLLVGAMFFVFILWPHDDGNNIARISCEVMPISNVEYSDNIIFQLNTDQPGKVRLNITVRTSNNMGAVDAVVEVSGPGFSKMTNTTSKYGKTQFLVTFGLPSSVEDYITIKASGGHSGLGGSEMWKIPVQVK